DRRSARLQPCVDGKDGEVAAADIERDYLHGGAARVHLGFVERPHANALESAGAEGEEVRRHVQAIRPDAELRIVVESVTNLDGVEVPPASDRIPADRSGEALVGRGDGVAAAVNQEGEVGDDPAVFKGVVKDDRIAEV